MVILESIAITQLSSYGHLVTILQPYCVIFGGYAMPSITPTTFQMVLCHYARPTQEMLAQFS